MKAVSVQKRTLADNDEPDYANLSAADRVALVDRLSDDVWQIARAAKGELREQGLRRDVVRVVRRAR